MKFKCNFFKLLSCLKQNFQKLAIYLHSPLLFSSVNADADLFTVFASPESLPTDSTTLVTAAAAGSLFFLSSSASIIGKSFHVPASGALGNVFIVTYWKSMLTLRQKLFSLFTCNKCGYFKQHCQMTVRLLRHVSLFEKEIRRKFSQRNLTT